MSDGDKAQFPGWPITVKMTQNDGRQVKGWLPKLNFTKANPVVQVINDKSKEVQYTIRVQGKSFQPKVYSTDPHTVKVGKDKANNQIFSKTRPVQDRKNTKALSIEPYL